MAINGDGDGDDVNKSQSGGDFALASLGRLERSFKTKTLQEQKLEDRRQRAEADAELAARLKDTWHTMPVEKGQEKDHWKKYQEKLDKDSDRILGRVAVQQKMFTESKIERLNRQAVNAVNNEYSPSAINSMVANSVNMPEVQQRATGLSQNSWESLIKEREGIFSQVGRLREDNSTLAGIYFDESGANPNIQDKFASDAQTMRGYAVQLAPINAALKQQKQMGLDPESRQQNLLKTAAQAQGIVNFEGLQRDIQGGNSKFSNLNAEDMKKKEVEAAQKLVQAMDELRASAGKTKEELAKLNKNAEDAASELKEVQEAQAAGAGGGNKLKTAQILTSAAGQAFSLIAQGIQTIGVNQPMAQMANLGSVANIENQKYDMFHSALGGNMTSLLNMGGWKNAEAFGGRMAENTKFRQRAEQGAAIGATATGIAQTADAWTSAPGKTIASKFGLANADTVQSLASGALATGEGALSATVTGFNQAREIDTTQARVAGTNQAMNTFKQFTHISGQQLQAFRDHTMGMLGAGRGMGSQADSFMDYTTGGNFMGQMKNVGLGIEEAGRLAQYGQQNMGSTFSAGMLIAAKDTERRGLGSAQEHMQRYAALAAGGQNPQDELAGVMKNALTEGFDNSKALNIIADNTGQMVEREAMAGGVGGNLAEEISRIITRSADKANPNQEFAIRQAAETHMTEEQFRNNRSASFAGQIAVARQMKGLGVSWEEGSLIQGMSSARLNEIGKLSKKDQVEALFEEGIDVRKNKLFQKDPKAFLSSAVQNKLITEAERAGTGFGMGVDFSKVQDWVKGSSENARAWATGDISKMPKEIQDQLLKQNIANKLSNSNVSNKSVRQNMMAVGGFLDSAGMPIQEPTGAAKAAFDLRAAGDRRQIDQANAPFQTESGTQRIGGVNEMVQELVKGAPSEQAWAEAPAKAARDFGESAVKLNIAGDKLTMAAEKLMIVSNMVELLTKNKKEDFTIKGMPTEQLESLGGGHK